MRTELAILGVTLMIGAVLPGGVAHWGDASGFGDDDKPLSVTTDGVAGRVVGVAGHSTVDVGGNVEVAMAIGGCDFEVADVTGGGAPQANEVEVDENPTNGAVPDNTWDDGGEGAACHSTAYANSGWNTEGCGEATDHAEARANPRSPVLGAFLGVGCDIGTMPSRYSVGNTIAYGVCLINTMMSSGPKPIQCLDAFRTPDFRNCQNDGVVDAINYGYANEASGPPVPTKTETQQASGSYLDCSDTAGETALFVLEDVDQGTPSDSGSGPATHVWTV